jgi:hypothetical protein
MIIPYKIDFKIFKPRIYKNLAKLGKNSFLITDYPFTYDTIDQDQIIDVKKITDEFLENHKDHKFLYAVENNSLGIPLIKKFIAYKINFVPIKVAAVGGYVYDNHIARTVIEEEYVIQEAEKFTKMNDPGSIDDAVNLCQTIEATSRLEGDIVELGVFRGSSSCIILNFLDKIGSKKDVWFFDTFEGFTYKEASTSIDTVWKDTHQTEGYEQIKQRLLSKIPLRKNVFVEKLNIISDELPEKIKKISLCNIDVDMFEAVDSALKKVSPLVVQGGIIICEDAGHTPLLIGARLALDYFLNSTEGKKYVPIHMPSGQVLLIKTFS